MCFVFRSLGAWEILVAWAGYLTNTSPICHSRRDWNLVFLSRVVLWFIKRTSKYTKPLVSCWLKIPTVKDKRDGTYDWNIYAASQRRRRMREDLFESLKDLVSTQKTVCLCYSLSKSYEQKSAMLHKGSNNITQPHKDVRGWGRACLKAWNTWFPKQKTMYFCYSPTRSYEQKSSMGSKNV